MLNPPRKRIEKPIPGLTSTQPIRINDITLVNVVGYQNNQASDIQEKYLANLNSCPSANPYADDPYDSLVRIKHQVNNLCSELVESGAFTEKDLKIIFTKNDLNAILMKAGDHHPIIESGILREFKFTKAYALRVSRETIHLIRNIRSFIAEGQIPNEKQKYLLLPKTYFNHLRYIYTNIGKMHALAHYFDDLKNSKATVKNSSSKSGRTDYQVKVKQKILELLEEKYLIQGKKFTTINSAANEIKHLFEIFYENLKISSEYDYQQQFFQIDSLTRNFQKWLREDAEFKAAASKYINLKL